MSYSDFPTEPSNVVVPSYQMVNTGPWGRTISGQIEDTAKFNTAFDNNGWLAATQNGCLPPPCKEFPTYPPPSGTGFIYPTLEKEEQKTLMGEEKGCFNMAAPFVNERASLPSIQLPAETVNGKDYSPSALLNMYQCAAAPQAMDNTCFSYMPYDKSYLSTKTGPEARYDGFLDNALSPVPITSPTQPIAVGRDIPSNVNSDRNPFKKNSQQTPEEIAAGIPPQMTGYGNDTESRMMNFQPPTDVRENFHVGRGGPTVSLVASANPLTTEVVKSNQPPTMDPNMLPGNFVSIEPPLHQIFAPPMNPQDPRSANNMDGQNMAAKMAAYKARMMSAKNNSDPYNNMMIPIVVSDNSCKRSENNDCASFDVENILPCMIKAIRGILHDLLNYDSVQIESNNSEDICEDKLTWIFTHNDRFYYLLTFIMLLVIVYYVLKMACQNIQTSHRVMHLYWIAVIIFIIYLAMPRTKGIREVQKLTALIVMALILWSFWGKF